MNEVFKCPACAAPLGFEGKTMQKCKHCGSNIIVPSDTIKNSDFFGGKGLLDFGDVSDLTGKTLAIAEIYRHIQSGNKIMAIKVFRATFGGSLKEAKEAVDDLTDGKSIDISGMEVQTSDPQTIKLNLSPVKKDKFSFSGTVWAAIILSAILIAVMAGAIIYTLFIKDANQ